MGQEYLSLQRSTRFKGRKSEQLFALDIKGSDTVAVQGALESRIVQAVAEWSRRTDSSIKVSDMTFSRELRHCFVVYDLVRVVLNGRWNNPGSHLVTAIVGPDAEQRGVGQRKGVLITRFDLPPETAALVRPDYDVLNNAVKCFEATYPDVASDLRARIKKAVEYCIDSH